MNSGWPGGPEHDFWFWDSCSFDPAQLLTSFVDKLLTLSLNPNFLTHKMGQIVVFTYVFKKLSTRANT